MTHPPLPVQSTMRLAMLKPYPGNSRRGDVATIKASLRRYGQYKPIVVQKSTGYVIAGNHTMAAARELGWETMQVSVVDCDDETATRINLIDNRASDLASNDVRDLLAQLQSLPDLDDTAFTDADLLALIAEVEVQDRPKPQRDPDDAPPVPEGATVCKPGQLWTLGAHRLYVGSALVPASWTTLLGGDKADLVWTDPPYGVDIQERDMAQAKVRGRRTDGKGVLNDDLTGDALATFLNDFVATLIGHTKPGACWYVASPGSVDHRHFLNALAGPDIARHVIIWVKDRFVMGRADYHYRHEPIVYGWTPGGAHHPVPDRKQDTVWEIARPGRSPEHPTMKPVELITRAINNSSKAGALVVDAFGGSGSTLIAAERTGRRAALIELDPAYADVILRRYYEHTGVVPTCADGTEWPTE